MPSATAWFLLTLITTNHVLSLDTHYDHTSNVWDHHSVEEPFLTLWNLSLKTCVTKCQLRKACRAVNYCRTRRSCQLLETNSGELPSQNVTEEFNVFVRMIDVRMTPQLSQTLSACNCTVNQTCLLHNASCIVTECRKLKVANGIILGNMVNVGARVKVVCNDLYKLDNASQDQVVCRADGQWLPAITCAPYTACGPPPPVNNATFITFTNVSDVISAVYECDVGCDTPSALNDTSVECLSNNIWGAIGFECLAVCGAPPNVTLATVSAGENLHGFTKVYTCDAGHAVNGSANITCQADATWSQIQFECIVDCSAPPLVPNGVVLAGDTVEESVRNYTCNTKYAPNSTSTTVTCQMDGNWTAVEFACIIDCDIPPAILNAKILPGGRSEGNTRTYTCNTGHVFRNLDTPNITCQSDSTWSTASFDCLWDCGAPPLVPNGVVLAGDTVEESVRNYTCNTRYAPNSTSTTVTCQMDGNWTAVEFACIIDCGIPPAFLNAEVLPGGRSEGDTRTYTCNTGHVFRNLGTPNITCQPDSTWSTASFDCLWDCGPTPTVPNADVNVSDTVEASVGTYTCNTGYVANDTTTITCQAGASWSDVAFYCVVDCGEPPAINNSQVSASGTREGDIRNYTCTTSHVFRNLVTANITCQSDSTWSVPSFVCFWDCGLPPTVANAVVSAGDTVENEVRGYTCNTGYAAVGTTTVTCQTGSMWTAVEFSCFVDCDPPPDFPNVNMTGSGTLHGDTHTYSCVTGYVLRNVTTVDTTCQSNGTWSVPSFECIYDCGIPPTMSYGTVSSGNTLTGSTRTYTCDYGYGTTGTATITCQDGAGWSAPTSTCTALVCDSSWHKIGESCYYIPGTDSNWEKTVDVATEICHSYNAYLVQLETEVEANDVEYWLTTEDSSVEVWIGITDKDVEGTWVWINSSEPTTWTDWDTNGDQPNGGTGQNYCRLGSNGLWQDKKSSDKYLPLCEKRFWYYTSGNCAF